MPEITAVASSFEELASAVSLAAEKNLHLTVKEVRDETSDTVVYHLKSETNAGRKIRNLFSSEAGKSHDRQVKNAFLVFANKLKADGNLDVRERLSLAIFEDALRETHTNNLHGSRSVVWNGLLKEAFDDRDVKIPVSTKTSQSQNFTSTVREETDTALPASDTSHEYDIPVLDYEVPLSGNAPIEPYAVVHASELDDTPIIPPRDPKLPPQNYLDPQKTSPQASEEPVTGQSTRPTAAPIEPYSVVDVTTRDT